VSYEPPGGISSLGKLKLIDEIANRLSKFEYSVENYSDNTLIIGWGGR
jgi:hypothetical protein